MRKEFKDLYVSYREQGLTVDNAYLKAYSVICSKYDKADIDRELGNIN